MLNYACLPHVDRYEYGMVAHALSGAVSFIFQQYLVLVAQLEKKALQGQLSPNSMWYHIQPSLHILEMLDGLCENVSDARVLLIDCTHRQAFTQVQR